MRIGGYNPSDNASTRVAIRMEGRIENLRELARLVGCSDHTPVAVLEAAYLHYEEKLFGMLEGSYALLIHDPARRLLYLSRDFAGRHPLYYRTNAQGIRAATTLAELQTQEREEEIDSTGLLHYLQYGFIHSPYTIFQNCYKLPPGTYLRYDLIDQALRIHPYWRLEPLYAHPKSLHDEHKLLQQIAHLLQSNLERALAHTDGTIGVMLSGGYDSATIAALLAHKRSHPIEAITVGFDHASYDESKDAAAIAAHLHLPHHTVRFGDTQASRIVPDLCTRFEEPFADFGAAPTLLLAQYAKKRGITSLFVGDGGDEVFATADNLDRFLSLRRYRPLLRPFLPLLDPDRLFASRQTPLYYKYKKLRMLLEANSITEMIKAKEMIFLPEELERLTGIAFDATPHAFDRIHFAPKTPIVDQITGTHFLTSMEAGELVKTYTALSRAGISSFAPFLDRDLIALLAQVPASLKLKGGVRKYLLKRFAHEMIPKELMERPKRGLNIPFGSWMRGVLREDLMEHLGDASLKRIHPLDPQEVARVRDGFFKGEEFYQYRLWNLYLFARWYRCRFR